MCVCECVFNRQTCSARKHVLATPRVLCDVFYFQCSNESVFAADFHPTDSSVIVTCGKSHLHFWTLEKGTLVKKQGLFEVGHQTHAPLIYPLRLI